MASRFSKYRKESETSPRQRRVRKDPLIEQVMKIWESNLGKEDTSRYYDSIILHGFRGSVIRARDISYFAQSLPGFEGAENFSPFSGLFISALVALSPEKKFRIALPDLDKPIDELGYRNTKHVTVVGSLGEDAGHWMREGTLTVQGNVQSAAGNRMEGGSIKIIGNAGVHAGMKMGGGTIEVCGSAGDLIGDEMEDGHLIIRGSAGEKIGLGMFGGRIDLEGGFAGLSNYFNGGEVYHKGVLIR
jgi:hypothetical protein